MTSAAARDYIFSLEIIGIKLGLDQIRALVAQLGHPDRTFTCIVVAGTNGKGSVTAMIERALRAQGYRTGRYTSPHLIDIEERIAIDGVPISREEFDRFAARVEAASTVLPSPPSFFEATTAIALDAFRDRAVDIAVLEVGLGGRLDATNVVTPAAVVITSVDFDHEQYLGDSLEAIAGEKAGVIKPGCIVVLAPNPPVVTRVVARACAEAKATLIQADRDAAVQVRVIDGQTHLSVRTPDADLPSLTLGLRGRHQAANALTAVRLLTALRGRGIPVSIEAIETGLRDVVWPGRLEHIATVAGDVLIDGAHNPAGAAALASYLHETFGRRVPFVVGVMQDKKIDRMIQAFAPAASHFVFTAPQSPRAARPDDLVALAHSIAPDVPGIAMASPADALAHAHTLGSPVIVAGSLYLAGEVRARITG